MLRYILIMLSITILSGCSELQVIGSAAMRELRSEGLNVEQISYNYQAKLDAREKAGTVMVAKADSGRIVTDGRSVGNEKKFKMAKAKRVKGLWEQGAL